MGAAPLAEPLAPREQAGPARDLGYRVFVALIQREHGDMGSRRAAPAGATRALLLAALLCACEYAAAEMGSTSERAAGTRCGRSLPPLPPPPPAAAHFRPLCMPNIRPEGPLGQLSCVSYI